MRKKGYAIFISMLNLYYFISWLLIFYSFDNQTDRKNNFLKVWLLFDNINTLDVILSLLTAISLILIIRKSNLNRFIDIICLLINVLFLLFMVWSHL